MKEGERQLVLELPQAGRWRLEDFLAAPGNQAALHAMLGWPDWPTRALVLYGPPGSGKTHLARIWAERSSAVFLDGAAVWGPAQPVRRVGAAACCVVDDAHAVAEPAALFHLHNAVLGGGGWLLLTGEGPVAGWDVPLPDLRSRLLAAVALAIQPPDDALLAALLVKQLADRQLTVEPPVVAYLVPRLERSFAGVRAAVEALDRASLRARRSLTVPLARTVLDYLADGGGRTSDA